MKYRKEIYSRYTSNFQPESRGVLEESQANRWGRAYDHYFRNWLPSAKNAAILDLACGGGRLLHFLKTQGYTNLSGVDISPEQVALAKSVTSSVFAEDILTFLGKHKGAYDLITGIDVIEHLTKDEVIQFLKDCYRSLRPGGRIVLQTPNADSPLFSSVWYHDMTHEVGYTPHSLKGLLKLAGFRLIEARGAGPIPLKFGLATGLRLLMWKLLRTAVLIWNLVEMGNKGSGIYTRVFLVSAVK